eukprot:gene7553-8995_t
MTAALPTADARNAAGYKAKETRRPKPRVHDMSTAKTSPTQGTQHDGDMNNTADACTVVHAEATTMKKKAGVVEVLLMRGEDALMTGMLQSK